MVWLFDENFYLCCRI
ncbi:unnamed protein product [Tuber melanosporum]|uniref:(Perigord truffle) hypothetical protein n=1 Tax=Tuber melanosporum (strain Mel28) TaxID=656061 RepID=D5GKW8_TUBMM|nr:unnamed protein product [Tuber melanosporum]